MKLLNQMKGGGAAHNAHYLTKLKYAVLVIVTDGTGMMISILSSKKLKR